MKDIEITNSIKYIGASDESEKLFESQYSIPNGMAYNSYIIKDEKNVILDTVDKNVTDEWINNIERELEGKKPDYLIISHLEPDHSYNIGLLVNKYPEMKIVGNATTFRMLPNFFDNINIGDKKVEVKDKDTLNIGKHTLQFFMAPMVHWPEVMLTFEQLEGLLFSADAFGKFGKMDSSDEWVEEARRYYFGIVGKYGMQVQNILNKVSSLQIKMICPLHGPILKENLEYYINKYDIWSKYIPEKKGIFIAYASIYGNTKKVAEELLNIVKEKNIENVAICDLVKDDMAKAVSDAFSYDKMIIAASSYNAGVFPPMAHFLNAIKDRNYQNRTVGIVENGSWAPSAGKSMKAIVSEMKQINLIEPIVTINSTMKEENISELKDLVEFMM